MKKVLNLVLTIAMLVAIFSTVLNLGAASAASNDYLKMLASHHKPSSKPTIITTSTPSISEAFMISVEDVDDAKPNEYITVPVSFINVPVNGIGATDMAIIYDPTLLECVSIKPGNIVPDPELNFGSNNPTKGIIKLFFIENFVNSDCISTDGIFANITFKIIGTYDKYTAISVSEPSVADIDLSVIPVTTIASLVDIKGTEPAPDFQVNIGSTNGYTGDLVDIPVSFSNVPASGIQAIDMTLNYDGNQLEYVSYATGSIVSCPSDNFSLIKESDGKLKILSTDYLFVEGNDIKLDGLVVNLTFKVLSSGESTVYASGAKFQDTNLNVINTVLVPGQVSLSETPFISDKIGVYYGSFYQTPDRPSTFLITFKNLPSTALSSVSMTIDYDPTVLEFVDAERLSLDSLDAYKLRLTKDITIQEVSEKSFKLFYKTSDPNGLSTVAGGFANLYFNILSPSTNDASFQVKDVTFTDKYGNPVDADIYSSPVTKTSIDTVEASPGSTVVVPIRLESIPYPGIHYAIMVLDYNSEVLEYVSYEDGSIISGLAGLTVTSFQSDGSKLQVVFYTSSDFLTTKGDLAYITFKVKADDGFSPIKFRFNPEILTSDLWSKVLITNGGVTISGKGSPVYTVSGYVCSDLGNANVQDFSFNEGFKVELAGSAFSTATDSNGYFEIKNVPSRTYMLNITKANFLTRQIKNISVDKDTELSTSSNPIILWSGDLETNGPQDGAINLEDVMEICKAFNNVSGDDHYNETLDLNKDNAINLEDVMIVAKHFNKISSDY